LAQDQRIKERLCASVQPAASHRPRQAASGAQKMHSFYPVGLPSHGPDAWKTSYETQNELITHERSPYPPGTGVHLPGARDHFGFGSPGANPAFTSTKSSFARCEDPDAEAGMAAASNPASPSSVSFQGPTSPMAQAGNAMLQATPKSMRRTASSPGFDTYKAPRRLSAGVVPVHKFEDDHHSYFVPASMRHAGEHKIQGNYSLPKLSKDRKLAATVGDGTGFRCQGAGADWWPQPTGAAYEKPMTQYQLTHGC